jgi:Fe-S oxidoreductase
MSPLDVTYGGISGYVIFWGLCVVASALFFHRIYQLYRYLLLGKKDETVDHLSKRLFTTLSHVVGQWPQFKSLTPRDRSGVGHVFIAWGFFMFVIYYLLFILIGTGFGISRIMETKIFYCYTWVMDVISLFIIAAAAWGIMRRYIIIPSRLKGEQTFEAMVILVTVLIHPLTHLLKVATGIALGLPPAGVSAILPPISGPLSYLFSSDAHWVRSAHNAFFWTHWSAVLFVLVYIPYTRYLHVIAAPCNIFLLPSRSQGTLTPINFNRAERLGASEITDFTRKQILDLYSCVVCGRCQDVCPAYATGKPLNPKQIVRTLYRHLLQAGSALVKRTQECASNNPNKLLMSALIAEDEIRSCTMCGACVETCPVSINQTDKIVELRRNLVYEGKFDRGQKTALKRVAQNFNPLGIPWNKRSKNTGIEEAKEGESYDCIYWLGCAAAFDETAQEIVKATAGILKVAGLKFSILGKNEKCCGDFVRRIGDEGLFQKLVGENVKELNKFDFGFILTHCPHCFNTLKNEYPDFGGNFKVIHHTQLILDLLKHKKVHLHQSGEKIIYHDPCYLGRLNGIYNEPRQILKEVFGKILEFPRNHNKSFCCGAGGGHMWKEEETGSLISSARTEEGLESNPQMIATACPYCLLMFEEAIQIKGRQDDIKVRDIAQLVERFS